MTRVSRLLCSVFLLLPALAMATVPAGYRFSSLTNAMPVGDVRDAFAGSQASLTTATNNNGHHIGFRIGADGSVQGYSVALAANPQLTALLTDNFVGLSAADASCWWFFCITEIPFGARLLADGEALTAFANTPVDATAIPGSLPLVRAPGHFVEENRNGIIASTQVDATHQFGVLVRPGALTFLDDVPWLVAINDLAQPLILGYGGSNGDCTVFGRNCPVPEPVSCVGDGDTHVHKRGKGHQSHGNGNGYGHYKCRAHHDEDGDYEVPLDPGPAPGPHDGALLIRLHSDGSTSRLGFPVTAQVDGVTLQVRNAFPLALNDTRAVLRGDVYTGSDVLDKRLLSCTFNAAALDANLDGIVDCTGGMQLVGGTAGSIRLRTVFGFTLTNSGLLAGNHGYNAAGVGTPFVLSLAAAQPAPVTLSNLAPETGGWELHMVTDANQNGKLVGYGYRDCAPLPQAFFLDPLSANTASALRFGHGSFEWPARLASGGTLTLAPTVSGGSGNYQFRTQVRTAADSQWQLLSDWSASAGQWSAGNYLGDVCFRIEARDVASPASVQQTVVRYSVVSTLPTSDGRDLMPVETTGLGILRLSGGDPALIAVLGAGGAALLGLLTLLALRRRARR